MRSLETFSLGLERAELGRDELAVALRTGGVAFGPGDVREIDPLATRVVVPAVGAPLVSLAPVEVERAVAPVFDTLAGRLGGRVGGDVVAIYGIYFLNIRNVE